MNRFIWLVRRELWENRAIWTIPAFTAAALILATLFGRVQIEELTSVEQMRAASALVLIGFGAVFFGIMSVYSTWYLIDCLYTERKDRSILFWKSLPIADSASVLAKLCTALVAIPLVYLAATDAATLVIAFIVSVRARATLGGALFQPGLWLQLQALWMYGIAAAALWYLPLAGWLLVVSAWARRAATLWAVMPPLAVVLLEKAFLGSHAVADLLGDRIAGFYGVAFHANRGASGMVRLGDGADSIVAPASLWQLPDPGGFLSRPATWTGVLVGAALVYAAVQLRWRRVES